MRILFSPRLPNAVALVACSLIFAARVDADPVRAGYVEAELIAEPSAIRAGEPFTVGVALKMDEHWHTYWQNPGDSGMPTTIEWKLPEGFSAGAIQWPVPQNIPTPPLVSYGYEGEALLLVEITPPADLPAGQSVSLEADVAWLVCREECLPGDAHLTLTLPVTDAAPPADSANAPRFTAARERLPVDSNWPATFSTSGNTITLAVPLPDDAQPDLASTYFFASTPDAVAPAGTQTVTRDGDQLILQLTKHEYADQVPDEIAGVLVADGGIAREHGERGVAITAHRGTATSSTAEEPVSLLALLFPAFLGGLILNLMPCVFPVLGVKILGFVNQAGADRRKITLHGIVFTAGVLVSFWALAGLLIALRAGGQELGWGFQLQSPGFVFALTAFLLAFALNLSGAFEFGLAATSVGGSLQMRSGYSGSFFTGVLATVVSTPCAAPFLAPALGAALALPAVPSLALFTMIALGLALPYLFLSAFPQFVKRLPRPGPWMETFKQFMAFPLYATVAFLVYVLAGQVEDEVFLITLGGLVLIALGLWGYGRWTQHGGQAKRRVFGYGFATACVALGLGFGYPGSGKTEWQDWRPGLPEELSRDGKIVYVDFTARWCATCKVNKLRVLNTTHIQEEFARRGVVRLKADWTNEDPEITRALESFGRSAVPLNVVYAPGLADPILLPEILTDDNVLAALDAAQAAKTAKR